jgi:topoisomerase-4 subunit A
LIELEIGTRLVAYVAGAPTQPILLAASNGFGFACTIGDMVSRLKAGKQFMTVDEGATPLRPGLVDPMRDARIACVSEKGRLLVFAAAEIKAQAGGGRGVTLMGLDEGEAMTAALPCSEDGIRLTGTYRNKPSELSIAGKQLQAHLGHRARKGTLARSGFKPLAAAKLPPAAG